MILFYLEIQINHAFGCQVSMLHIHRGLLCYSLKMLDKWIFSFFVLFNRVKIRVTFLTAINKPIAIPYIPNGWENPRDFPLLSRREDVFTYNPEQNRQLSLQRGVGVNMLTHILSFQFCKFEFLSQCGTLLIPFHMQRPSGSHHVAPWRKTKHEKQHSNTL